MTGDNKCVNKLRKSRLFILGAGFSAASGIPLTDELLKLTMQKISNEKPDFYDSLVRISNIILRKKSEAINLSEVKFATLADFVNYLELTEHGGSNRMFQNGSTVKFLFQHYLAKTIEEYTPTGKDIPDIYIDFVKQLSSYDTIMSFNWDLLLENALTYVGLKYEYKLEFRTNPRKIHIRKPHGSINWSDGWPRRLMNRDLSYQWNSLNFKNRGMQNEVYFNSVSGFKERLTNCRSLDEIKPFIVLPGFFKGELVKKLAPFWYYPEAFLSDVDDIYIIGLSLSEDDFIINYFIKHVLDFIGDQGIEGRKIFVINPNMNCIDAGNSYMPLLDSSHTVLFKERFAYKHVEFMKNRMITNCNKIQSYCFNST